VSYLAGEPVIAVIDRAVEDDARAHSSTERDDDSTRRVASGPNQVLGISGRVRVVVDDHRQRYLLAQHLGKSDVVPCRKIR
jgi:hypothetical protein